MSDPQRDVPSGEHDTHIPSRGRLIGIDFGTVRVGVSVSDIFQKLASPLHNYQRVSRQADEQFFRRQFQEYEVTGIVVGLPLHMNGDEGEKSREARSYGRWLHRISDLPVTFQDERLSSAQADVLLHSAALNQKQRDARIDKLAAQIILQTWMDRRAAVEGRTNQV
jgi:putative Holliday junction resolvase